MERRPDSRLNSTALLSLLVGIFGTACLFWGIAGIAAIVLGIVATGEIKRSEGAQHGRGLAIAGITVGALHLFALVLGTAAMLTLAVTPAALAGRMGRPKSPGPSFVPPVPSPAPAPTASAAPVRKPGNATREEETRTTLLGKVTLVDPGADVHALKPLVLAEQTEATGSQQKLLVWVTATDCQPCTGVSVALTHKRMQDALAGVRLLRVDAADFRHDLSRLGVPIDVMPGFALLGADGAPLDYVNGGEWDADIPENIAPVLGAFVRGTYKNRRTPWRGVRRSDETAL